MADLPASDADACLFKRWQFEDTDSSAGAIATTATVLFDDTGFFSGFSGCAPFRGSHHFRDSTLYLSNLIAEESECDEARTRLQAQLFAALSGEVRFQCDSQTLVLENQDGGRAVFRALPNVVSGRLIYRERIALPVGARAIVCLEDISRRDVDSFMLAEQIIEQVDEMPIAFSLPFDPATLSARNRYALRASIVHDQQLLFITTDVYWVLTYGGPSEVDLVLHRVRTPEQIAIARPEEEA